ncbi:MAG: Ig-like domain-containing protein [Spirochaetales bacterium]|nr:Ig-like domain-containing protein [Spirochaetales bacterium]
MKTFKKILMPLFILYMVTILSCDMLDSGLGENVDLSDPEIAVSNEANFYVMGTTELSGTLSDDKGISSVTVSYTAADDTEQTVNATFSSSSWSLSLVSGTEDSASIAEGEQTLTITVTDTGGKTTSVEHSCRVDNTMPTVLITSPLEYMDDESDDAVYMSKYIDIKGEIYDEFSLGEVTVELIDSTDDSVISTQTADGTVTWSTRFYLKSTSDEGETLSDVLVSDRLYTINVYAEDGAGNINEGYLHRDDFYEMIPDLDIFPSMDEIGLADRDEPVDGSDVTSHDQLEAYRHYSDPEEDELGLVGFTYTDDDQPEVIYHNLDKEASDASDNEIYQVDALISGTVNPVSNGPAIDSSTLSVLFYEDSDVDAFVSLSNTEDDDSDQIDITDTGDSITFSLSLKDGGEDFPVGDYRMILSVEDEDGTAAPTEEVLFCLTAGESASVEITSPEDNITWTSSSDTVLLTLEGTVSNYSTGSMTVSLNDGTAESVTETTTGWSYDFLTADFDALDDGYHVFTITAGDAEESWRFTKDTVSPEISIITPLSGTSHNGSVTLKGTSSDDNEVSTVKIFLGKDADPDTDTGITLDGTYSWEYELLNLDNYANTTYATETETDSNVWNLPIYISAEDGGGNVYTESDYYIYLDPDGDTPTIEIMSPSDEEVTGGSVRVYGTASDDDSLYAVYYQLDVNGDGDYDDTAADYPDGSGTYDETTLVTADGTNSWSFTLNSDGELASSTSGEQSTINLRVKAQDSKDSGSTGDTDSFWSEISLTIDNTIPIVEEVKIDYDSDTDTGDEEYYTSGMTVSGSFWIDAIVKDESGIAQIDQVNSSPLSSTEQIDDDSSITSDLDDEGGYVRKSVRIPIDSADADYYEDTSGSITLSIKVTDTSSPNPYVTYYSMTLLADNYYPEGSYTASSDLSGESFELAGTATDVGTDSGTVAGIEKIVLYLEDSGTYYDLSDGSTSTSTDSLTVKNLANSDLVEAITIPATSSAFITIDSLTELGSSDSDGDGFVESLVQEGNDYDWTAEIDSTNLPDGSITLHSLIYDEAGNISHSSDSLFVMNDHPEISSIELGTDLDFSGTIDADESTTYTDDYDTTGFTVRNNLLNVTVNSTGGNGTVYYSLYYDGSEQNGTLTESSIDMSSFAGDTSSENGAEFTLQVYDSVGLNQSGGYSDESITLAMNLDNTDETSPTLAIAPFGQYYDDGDDESAKVLEDVEDYSDNILLDSDDEVQGHVEYAADSSHDGTDADLSGEVIFYGKAWDNQKIDTITATVDGYNSDTAFTVYDQSAGGSQSGTDWTFALEGDSADEGSTGYITEDKGNVFNWAFTFDTSQISDVAANDVTITFDISDVGGESSDGSDSLSFDVVPYITSLERGGTYNTNRSHYGKYPVQVGETITVNGFNLDGNTSYTVGDNSSYFSVTVNSIESINNLNDNGLSYNSEDDGSDESALWNDDRYLSVWDADHYLADTDDSGYYPALTMGSDGTLYGSWQDGINTTYWNIYDETGSARNIGKTYDPADYTDIAIDASDSGDVIPTVVYLANHIGVNPYCGVGPYDINNSGGIILYGENASLVGIQNSTGDSGSHIYGYGVEGAGADQNVWQFLRPKVATVGDHMHTAYYDVNTNAVKYSYVADDGNNMGTVTEGWIVLDGGYDEGDTGGVFDITTLRGDNVSDLDTTSNDGGDRHITHANLDGLDSGDLVGRIITIHDDDTYVARLIESYTDGTGEGTIYWEITDASDPRPDTANLTGDISFFVNMGDDGGIGVADGTGSVSQSSSAGEYVAIDLTSDGYPVVMYYDMDGGTLRLAYADNTTPTATSDWVRQEVFDSSDPYGDDSAGQHVAMKIDSSDNIHALCRQNSTGELLYLYGEQQADGSYDFDLAEVVDDSGSVGKLSDITLDSSDNPHISYLGISVGTLDGLKYAYKTTVDSESVWEYMIVPAENKVSTGDKQRTSIEYNTVTTPDWTGDVVISYLSDRFELIYLRGE